MRFERIELSNAGRMSDLTELFRTGSVIDDPVAMLSHFAKWFGRRRQADFFVSVSKRGLRDGEFKITRRIIGGPATRSGDPPNPWRDWNRLDTHSGGLIGELLSREELQVLSALDASDDPILGDDLAGMRTAIAIPTFDGGKALNWAISFFRDEMPRDQEFAESAMLDINMLGMATRNLVSRREAERLNGELTAQFERIAGIQRALLPQRLPKIPGLELATSYLTSNEAGGDYYDFFEAPGGRWGILIADVAGHGAAAATVMAMLRGILHCYEQEDFSPSRVMEYANEKLLETNLPGTFITAFFAVYDPEVGALEFARCGHNPP
ncbi:MAG: hypothetical protein CMJ31_12110, partial [Phycisphaerae bacterium]|nr:hypothetical protein [Phycisphaerae bacterium]